MEKLLIVDDEEWILDGLKLMLPWEEMGIILTDTAENGLEAMDIIEKQSPDIVLTDVRMPLMDGLELAEKIYTRGISCEVIIISGYADFEYAKRAVAYNVSAYLTKPVQRAELDETVRETIKKLQTKREQEVIVKQFRENEENDKLSHYYLNEKSHRKLEVGKEYLTVVFQASLLRQKKDTGEDAGGVFLRLAKNENWNQGQGVFFRNHSNPNQYILIIGFRKESSYENVYKKIMHDFESFLLRARKEMDIEGIIGVGEPYANTALSFKSYLQAKFIVENMQSSRECRLVTISQFEKAYSGVCVDYDEINNLITAVEYGNRQMTGKIFGALAEKWKRRNDDSLIAIRMNIQEIIVLLSKIMIKYGSSMYELNREYADIFGQIWMITSKEKLMELSMLLTEAVTDYIDTVRNEGKEPVTLQIKRYVDEHFSDPLTLSDMAKQYYVNAAYLSRAFKKETGTNFNDYVRKLRMEKAIMLLRSTDMKIYEIAQLAGYDNVNYFMKKFQDDYGVTPGAFREGKVSG